MCIFSCSKPKTVSKDTQHWISTVLKPGEDVVWLLVDGKNLGFSGSKQQIVANKKFLEANSVAKRWFELVQIPALHSDE
ncbi:hypothetical protein [Okeania sp. SIO1I7]|uniref:hypothetical protein n=1 Tax=Okeania sp. SIO1I7 TaxID=2607772 RepID=UPI0025F592C3|nr:hypothetical protein [Okeania sp. SIO1I7]